MPLSTGVLMLSKEHIPFEELWSKYAKKYAELPDDFVLEFLLKKLKLKFRFIHTEFFDRSIPAQVVRGQWQSEGTIVQHPTTNRWENPIVYSQTFNGKSKKSYENFTEQVSRKRKYIYWRNFGGDFDDVDHLMKTALDQDVEIADWVFNPRSQQYSPIPYWPKVTDVFGVKPLTKEKFQTCIVSGFSENNHRERSLKRMRLNWKDKVLLNNNIPNSWLKSFVKPSRLIQE